jgi:hypothetical protein
MSGQIFEVTDTLAVGRMNNNVNRFSTTFFQGAAKVNVGDKYVYMNMANVEYIEERWIDVFDPRLLDELSRSRSEGIIDMPQEGDSLSMEQV